tara:strand:- start:11941 stop:12306 length:366 start_codon:yes stop_codon:yes gene_type:complete
LINQLLLICTAIIVYEYLTFINLRRIVQSNLKIFKKIFNLFKFKTVSDFRKEKLILNYSKSLFLLSIKILIIIFSILIFIFGINLLSGSFLKFLISTVGIVESCTVLIIYHLIRRKTHAKL